MSGPLLALLTALALLQPLRAEREAYRRGALSREAAREILSGLNPQELDTLDELSFLVDLPFASGSENNPLRLYRRVERELDQPQVVDPETVHLVLDDMAHYAEDELRSASALGSDPGTPASTDPNRGYELVKRMMASPQGALPSGSDAMRRILSFREHVAVAFLMEEYFATDHYHPYLFQSLVFEALATGGFDRLPLEVYEERLRKSWPSRSPTSEFQRVVEVGRAAMGADFDDWYECVRGSSYTWDYLLTWLP